MNPTGDSHLFSQRILDLRPFLVRTRVRQDLLDGVEARQILDMTFHQLAIELEKKLLVDQLYTDTRTFPVRGTIRTDTIPRHVLIELPRSWWQRLLRRAPRRIWAPLVGHAAVVGAGDEIPVAGTVEVRTEHLRTFPTAHVQYPSFLDEHYRVTVVTVADEGQFDPNQPFAP